MTPRSGRRIEFNEEQLTASIRRQSITLTKIGRKINNDHKTDFNHLHAMENVQKLGEWIPYEISLPNKNDRVNACASLLARYPFTVK